MMEKTVVALYDNLDAAQTAVQELVNAGIGRDDISVVRTNQQRDDATGDMTASDASGAAAGAGIGAVLGGLAGLLVGLGALAIPGIGPIIAAGPLATTLAGVGLGAATGGLVGALADAGIPEEEAGHYAEGVRRGGTLVTVRAGADDVSRATEILNRFAPVDINQRAGEWEDAGQGTTDRSSDYRASTGFTGANSGGTYEGTGSAGYTGSGTTYRGEGSFTSNTGASDSQGVQANDDLGHATRQDEESVMTSGHGEMSTSTGFAGQGGGTYERMQDANPTVHPRSSEGDYQARRDFLGGQETEGDYGSDRSASANMIQTGHGSYGSQGQNFEPRGDDAPSARFEDFDPDFRSDWETHYRSTGFGYDRYQPAYQYGWQLGDQYQGRAWNDFEANARTGWEQSHPNDAWQDFRSAVRQGWERFKSGVDRSQGAEQPYKGMEQGAQPGQAAHQDPRTFSYEARENLRAGLDSTVGDMSRGFDTFDQDFRSNWDRSYRATGYGYERYQPAYQYGYNLGTDARYRSRNWDDIESDVRRDWETRHPNDAWEDFKDAVQHAWGRVRGGVQDALD